jgi:hypothetical protein
MFGVGSSDDKILAWTQVTKPCHAVDMPAVNKWFQVDFLRSAGLGENQNAKMLFARQESVHLWTALDGMERGLIVRGSPGIGKSSEVWAWACHSAFKKNKSVLWIHVEMEIESICVILESHGCYWCKCRKAKSDVLEDLISKANVDILILDGYKSSFSTKDLVPAMFPLNELENRKGIIVSSMAGGLVPQNFGVLRKSIRVFEVGPWTLDFFLQSCSSNDFFQTVRFTFVENPVSSPAVLGDSQVQALIEEKFYYAGGSARWMFEYTVSEIKDHVQSLLDHVDNFKDLVKEARGVQFKEFK